MANKAKILEEIFVASKKSIGAVETMNDLNVATTALKAEKYSGSLMEGLHAKQPRIYNEIHDLYDAYIKGANTAKIDPIEARLAFKSKLPAEMSDNDKRHILEDLAQGRRQGPEVKAEKHLGGPEINMGSKSNETTHTTDGATHKTPEELAKAKASAKIEMTSILGDLNPSSLEKKELGTHLKNLESTAHKHNLIDGNLVSNRTAKDIESALDNGEHISPSEMKSFKTAIIKEFDDYADNQARKAVSLDSKRIATEKGEKTLWQSFKGTLSNWGGKTLAVTALGGALYGAFQFIIPEDSALKKIGGALGNIAEKTNASTGSSAAKAERERLASLNQECMADAAYLGEVTKTCIKRPALNGKYESLSEVFGSTINREADMLYMKGMVEKLQDIDNKHITDPNQYREAINNAQSEVESQIRENFKDVKTTDEAKTPNIDAVNNEIAKVMISAGTTPAQNYNK